MNAFNLKLSIGVISMTMCMSLSAQPQYVRIQNDILVKLTNGEEKNILKDSTFPVAGTDSFIVKIENTDGVLPKLLTGGIEVGAQFQGLEYNEDPSKVSFRDNDGKERSRIGHLKTSVYRYYIMESDTLMIPENNIKIVDVSNAVLPDPRQLFQYDSVNEKLQYNPQEGKNFTMKVVRNNGEAVSVSLESFEWNNVKKDETIRLILSHDNENYEDIILNVIDLPGDSSTPNIEEGSSWLDVFKNVPNGVWIFLLIVVLLALGYWIFSYVLNKHKKNDNLKKGSSSSDRQKENKKGRGMDKKNENPNQSYSNETHPVDQHSAFSYISQHFEENNKTLNDILESIGDLKFQISSINQGMKGTKELERLNKELEEANKKAVERKNLIDDLKGQLTSKNEEITKISNENANLKQELEDAKKTPDGVLMIEGINDFVKKAKSIMGVCYEAEVSIQNYIKSLSKEDSEKMAFFMATYIKNMPTERRNQWNAILSTLSIKGYINDAQVTPYLQQEQNQQGWLRKHFVEDLLQSYISPVLIMLDEIGNASNYGISMPYDTDSLINKIIKECEQFGARVKYVKSYQEVIDQELIDENDPDLPKEMEGLVVIKEGVPLFLSHIGVEAEGTRSDKTICVIRK